MTFRPLSFLLLLVAKNAMQIIGVVRIAEIPVIVNSLSAAFGLF